MNRKPSEDIPKIIADQHPVYRSILDWLDDIWVDGVWPEIDRMYDLLSYRRVDDRFLDLFLYDKGFSTSSSLTADMKRCILDNWNEIYRKRHTISGFKLYFGCMLTDLEIDFLGTRINNFIQDNSTIFSFGNAEMLATVNDPDGKNNPPNLMTYLYHPSYEKDLYLHLMYESTPLETKDLLDYVFNLIPLEFPKVGLAETLNVFMYTNTGENVTVAGKSVTISGSPTFDFTSLSTFNFIGIDNKIFKIDVINTNVDLDLDVNDWVSEDFYDKNEKVIGTDSKLYSSLITHKATTNFLNDVTSGFWELVEGSLPWQRPDPVFYT